MGSEATFHLNPKDFEPLYQGHKNVVAAGTAERLVASSTPCYQVLIQAKTSNTQNVFIGGQNVPNNNQGGVAITPGNSLTLNVFNLYDIWINSLVNNEGVTYIYWKQ